MALESPLIIAVLVAGAGFTGWLLGSRARRTRGPRAGRHLPAEYFTGLDYLINEQPDRAVEVFTRMVDVDTETVEIHFALGSLFRRRGEVDRAIHVHQSILERTNLQTAQREQALLELAIDYLRAGLLDRSEQLFQKLTGSPTHRVAALRSLTRIYEQQRDWRQAISAHRQLESSGTEIQPTAVAHYLCELAEAAHAQGDITDARELLREARRTTPISTCGPRPGRDRPRGWRRCLGSTPFVGGTRARTHAVARSAAATTSEQPAAG